MYRVIVRFVDLQDHNHVYHPGDMFPRSGKTVAETRLAELAGSNNKRGIPLIEKVALQATISDAKEQLPEKEATPQVAEDVEETQPIPVAEKKTATKPRARGGRKKKI